MLQHRHNRALTKGKEIGDIVNKTTQIITPLNYVNFYRKPMVTIPKEVPNPINHEKIMLINKS